MKIDLGQVAERLSAAAGRTQGLEVSVSNFDLILAKPGQNAGRAEAVPFAALFLSDRDMLGEALDRIEAASR